MATTKKNEKAAKQYVVKVKNNPNFVGIGAGGVQFANGQATVTSERMANWFREHKGYEVQEVAAPAEAPADEKPADEKK